MTFDRGVDVILAYGSDEDEDDGVHLDGLISERGPWNEAQRASLATQCDGMLLELVRGYRAPLTQRFASSASKKTKTIKKRSENVPSRGGALQDQDGGSSLEPSGSQGPQQQYQEDVQPGASACVVHDDATVLPHFNVGGYASHSQEDDVVSVARPLFEGCLTSLTDERCENDFSRDSMRRTMRDLLDGWAGSDDEASSPRQSRRVEPEHQPVSSGLSSTVDLALSVRRASQRLQNVASSSRKQHPRSGLHDSPSVDTTGVCARITYEESTNTTASLVTISRTISELALSGKKSRSEPLAVAREQDSRTPSRDVSVTTSMSEGAVGAMWSTLIQQCSDKKKKQKESVPRVGCFTSTLALSEEGNNSCSNASDLENTNSFSLYLSSSESSQNSASGVTSAAPRSHALDDDSVAVSLQMAVDILIGSC